MWRLSHLSVIEYFEGRQTLLVGQGRSHCGKVCLSFLIEAYGKLDDHSTSTHPGSSTVPVYPGDRLNINNPFHQYAKRHWPVHFRNNAIDGHSRRILKRFLGSPTRSSLYLRHWIRFSSEHDRYTLSIPFYDHTSYMNAFKPDDTPFFAMACLELYDPLQEWWEDESLDLLLKNSNGETLVAIAVRVRCIPSYKKLLSRLPENQRTMGCGIAVYAAAQQGDTELVKFLVQEGKANVNFVVEYYHTALSEACRVGPLDIVRYLVEDAQASVDVRTESDDYISAVAFACSGPSTGMLNLVKYLSEEANAVVDPPPVSGLFKSALEIASQRGLLDIVQYLVQEGKADINRQIRTSLYGNALVAASIHNHLDVIKYLVERDADVNQTPFASSQGNALAAACKYSSLDIVRYLVEQGNADVNLQFRGSLYGSALASAAFAKRFDMVEYLVAEAHADVNLQLQCGLFCTALVAALSVGSRDMVQFLVEEGNANINLQFTCGLNENVGSTWEYAMMYSRESKMGLLEYLVSHRTADVNIRHLQGPYVNPLSRAICDGYEKGVQILLSAGASADFRWNNGSLLRVQSSDLKFEEHGSGGRTGVANMLRKANPYLWDDEVVGRIP